MAFNFPSSPTLDQTYTSGSSTYKYNGSAWIITEDNQLASAVALNAIQINGGMEVSQAYGSGVVTPGWVNAADHPVDGWQTVISIATPGAAAFSVGTVDSTGAGPLGNLGIPWCLGITATGATTFSGVEDFANFYQLIEGTRFSRLGFGYPNAQPVTISFWIWTTRPGTGCMILGSYGAQYRCHIKEYTVTANEWQYKTLTFPPETSPPENWPTGTTAAAAALFCFGGGSTSKAGVANTWANWTTQYATANQTNFFAANNDAVYITGVTIVPGTQGPTAAQSSLATRSYATELAICQRYYYLRKSTAGAEYLGVGQAYNSSNVYGIAIPLPVTMRATPTVSFSSATHFGADNAGGVSIAPFTSGIALARSPHAIQIVDLTGSSGFVAGDASAVFFNTAGAWIQANARL